jgi:uncharacterized YigZ family protein
MDEYRTVSGLSVSKLTVKNSRFIGLARCVTSKGDMEEFLRYAMEEYPRASHYCYAYSVGLGEEKTEYSTDAGEPINSAGPPILSAIRGSGLENVGCIVVRYFGGIKLGVGGLIRAYGRCARECLANAKVETRILRRTLRINVPYDKISPVINLVKRLQGEVKEITYAESAVIRIELRRRDVPQLIRQLNGVERITVEEV